MDGVAKQREAAGRPNGDHLRHQHGPRAQAGRVGQGNDPADGRMPVAHRGVDAPRQLRGGDLARQRAAEPVRATDKRPVEIVVHRAETAFGKELGRQLRQCAAKTHGLGDQTRGVGEHYRRTVEQGRIELRQRRGGQRRLAVERDGARIDRRRCGKPALAQAGGHAVGGDQQIEAAALAVGEERRRALSVGIDGQHRHAVMDRALEPVAKNLTQRPTVRAEVAAAIAVVVARVARGLPMAWAPLFEHAEIPVDEAAGRVARRAAVAEQAGGFGRETGGKRALAVGIDAQAIALPAPIGRRIALENFHSMACPGQTLGEAQAAESGARDADMQLAHGFLF